MTVSIGKQLFIDLKIIKICTYFVIKHLYSAFKVLSVFSIFCHFHEATLKVGSYKHKVYEDIVDQKFDSVATVILDVV